MKSITFSHRFIACLLVGLVVILGLVWWQYRSHTVQSTPLRGVEIDPPADSHRSSSSTTITPSSSAGSLSAIPTNATTKTPPPDEMYELLHQQQNQPSGDPKLDILQQFDLIIDQKLGKDFPLSKRTKIAQIQFKLLADKESLVIKQSADSLSHDQLLQAQRVLVDQAGKDMAQILTHDEYEILFDIENDKPLSDVFIPPH